MREIREEVMEEFVEDIVEDIIRKELEELYIKNGNSSKVIKLSQYLDKMIIEKQILAYKNYKK